MLGIKKGSPERAFFKLRLYLRSSNDVNYEVNNNLRESYDN